MYSSFSINNLYWTVGDFTNNFQSRRELSESEERTITHHVAWTEGFFEESSEASESRETSEANESREASESSELIV